ncbi:MAG: hypothetical protein FWH15_01150 [Betaproteobacteria bacterium]|nr:hypothetical protein [Betaproteobacteria bacterium]
MSFDGSYQKTGQGSELMLGKTAGISSQPLFMVSAYKLCIAENMSDFGGNENGLQ